MEQKNLEIMKRELFNMTDDFAKKVQPIYKLLDWKWYRVSPTTNEAMYSIPSEKEIADTSLD